MKGPACPALFSLGGRESFPPRIQIARRGVPLKRGSRKETIMNRTALLALALAASALTACTGRYYDHGYYGRHGYDRDRYDRYHDRYDYRDRDRDGYRDRDWHR
jgi:hypothetical protein